MSRYVSKKNKMKFAKAYKYLFLILKICFLSKINFAQSLLSEKAAIDLALQKHPQLAKGQLSIQHAEMLTGTARNIPQPLAYIDAPNKWFNIGIEQNFALPKVYNQNEILLKQKVNITKAENAIFAYDIAFQTRLLYQHFLFFQIKSVYLKTQDRLFQEMNRIADTEYKVGQITSLEKLNMESFYKNIHQSFMMSNMEADNARNALESFLNMPNIQAIDTFQKLNVTNLLIPQNHLLPIQQRNEQNIILEKMLVEQQKMSKLPTFFVGLNQLFSNQFQYPVFRMGLYVPIWKKPLEANIQAAEIAVQIAQKEAEITDFELKNLFQKYVNAFKIAENQLSFYEKEQLPLAETILKGTRAARLAGELGAFNELQSLRQAYEVQIGYLNALKAYNDAVIYLNYFKN
jgi:outer membrane protein TolC